MLFRNTQRWSNMEETRGLLFFAQRLDELTHPYSLDSYKSPTTSIQTLILEILQLLSELPKYNPDRIRSGMKSVKYIVTELKLRLKSNWIAKKCTTIDLSKALDFDFESITPSECITTLEILLADLDDELYIAEIIDQTIALSSTNNKEKLDFLAKEFISVLQSRGMSRDHINQNVIEFFFGTEEIIEANCLKKFCQIVYPHDHRYIVFMPTGASVEAIDEDVLESQGMRLVGLDEKIDKNYEDSLAKLRNDNGLEHIIAVQAAAPDYNSAVSKARSRFYDVINFYKILNHKIDFQIGEDTLVIQACCDGIIKDVSAPKNHMHFIRDMRGDASGAFRRFNEKITLDVGPDKNKFKNILNMHGLSLSSGSSDIQLVNIWTCLEIIAVEDNFDSKVSNVVERIMPALLLGYYHRIIINLLFDILRWDRRSFSKCMSMCDFGDTSYIRYKFVRFLSEKDNEPALSEFYKKCRDFELLRYRTYTVSKFLKDPRLAKSKLDMHADIVRWQLHRIYRTRNKIAHAGESPSFINYLVENAHDFFDITLMFCIELSAWKQGFQTFDTCLNYADRVYKSYYKNITDAKPEYMIWTLPKTKGKSFIFDASEGGA